MPHFSESPYPTRYNSLRLLGHDYASPSDLYFITMITHESRPLSDDLRLAKSILRILLGVEDKLKVRIRAFTLLPDHLHFLISMGNSGLALPSFFGRFKSLTTREYWKRSREIVTMNRQIELPPKKVARSKSSESGTDPAGRHGMANHDQAIELEKWPNVMPGMFLSKQLWQESMYDHVIRNDADFEGHVEIYSNEPGQKRLCEGSAVLSLYGFWAGLTRLILDVLRNSAFTNQQLGRPENGRPYEEICSYQPTTRARIKSSKNRLRSMARECPVLLEDHLPL